MNKDNKEVYLKASKELDSDERDEAVWIKAMTLCDGDDSKARYKYIQLRVDEDSDDSSESINANVDYTSSGIRRFSLLPAQSRSWLYWTILIPSIISGITPLLNDDPEDSFTVLFIIGALLAAGNFLIKGQRYRFTAALLLGLLLNPFVIEELAYEFEAGAYFLAFNCSCALVLLHGRKEHYNAFKYITSFVIILLSALCVTAGILEDHYIEGIGYAAFTVAYGWLIFVPLFKHTIFRPEDEIASDKKEYPMPWRLLKIYSTACFVSIVVIVAMMFTNPRLTYKIANGNYGVSEIETSYVSWFSIAGIFSFIAFLIALISFLCAVVYAVKFIYRLNSSTFGATCKWLVIPSIHLSLTVSLVLLGEHLGSSSLSKNIQSNIIASSEGANEEALDIYQKTEEKLLDYINKYNHMHLSRWDESGLSQLFDGTMTKEKAKHAILACDEMSTYLESQKVGFEAYLEGARDIIQSSDIPSRNKDGIISVWNQVNLDRQMAEIAKIESKVIKTIKDMMIHLNNTNWHHVDGEYKFRDKNDSIKHRLYLAELKSLMDETQTIKSDLQHSLSELMRDVSRE
jgi:hypothetical protein